jgi:hypothetical protein
MLKFGAKTTGICAAACLMAASCPSVSLRRAGASWRSSAESVVRDRGSY